MKFVNNVTSTLESSISATSGRVRVLKAVAPMSDMPAEGKLTISDSLSSPTAIEIIGYSDRVDHGTYWTLTGVTRGMEDTTSSYFSTGAYIFQAFTAGDATNATPLKEPDITYVDSQITRIDYSGGEFKVFSYNLDESINTITVTIDSNTITKTFNYTDGVLTSVTEA